MTAEFLLDQERGKKNFVKVSGLKLGETGFVADTTKTGTMVIYNSGMLIEVMVVQASGALSSPAGLGVKFDAAEYGEKVSAFSGASDICDGIVDPDLTGNLASGDTFLLFRKGPFNIISSGSISAGAPIKPAASGKFQAATSESAPVRCGRLMVAATGADQSRRAYCDFTNP